MTVSATVKPRMYLHFPDLDPNAKGKPEKLQIGLCYMPGLVSTGGGTAAAAAAHSQPQLGVLSGVGKNTAAAEADRESEIVRPLRVRNVSDRALYLTCTPNLRKQCFVYSEIPSAETSSSSSSLLSESQAPTEGSGPVAPPGGEDGRGVPSGGGGGGGNDWLSAVPNRPQVADLPLLPQSETTLYVGLRPVLPLQAYTAG